MRLIKPSHEIWAMSGHAEFPYNYQDSYKLMEAAARVCYKTEDKIGPGTAEKFVEMLRKRGHLAMIEHSWGHAFSLDIHNFGNSLPQKDWTSDTTHCLVSGNIRMFEESGFYYFTIDHERAESIARKEKLWNHLSATVKFICDRGVTHELVRHRPPSYAQESTRYCDYSLDKFGGQVTFIIPPWVDVKKGIFNLKEYTMYNNTPAEYWFKHMYDSEIDYKMLLRHGWAPQQARSVLPNSLKTEIIVTATWREWQHIFNLRALGKTGRPHPQMEEIMLPLYKEFQKLEPECFGGLND